MADAACHYLHSRFVFLNSAHSIRTSGIRFSSPAITAERPDRRQRDRPRVCLVGYVRTPGYPSRYQGTYPGKDVHTRVNPRYMPYYHTLGADGGVVVGVRVGVRIVGVDTGGVVMLVSSEITRQMMALVEMVLVGCRCWWCVDGYVIGGVEMVWRRWCVGADGGVDVLVLRWCRDVRLFDNRTSRFSTAKPPPGSYRWSWVGADVEVDGVGAGGIHRDHHHEVGVGGGGGDVGVVLVVL